MPDTPSKQDGPSPSTTLSTPSTAPASSILQEPVGVPHISSSTQETNSFPSAPDDTSPTKRVRSGSSEQVNSSAKRSSKRIDTQQIRNDRLGTLVRQLCESLHESPSWESFVNEFRGPSYLSPDLDNIDHPAAPLLRQWRDQGVPAECDTEPWSLEQKDECIKRGCHYSANEHADFIREEMADFIEDKFWMVLPYQLVRHFENIMFSPGAIKEERERKPRFLCDHSWDWGWPSVNSSTKAHAPPEAMQFGWALPRILYAIRHANPKFGPTRLSKQDVKDGFYRLFLRALDCLRLAVVLPKYENECQLVAIPMSCTMGWVQSPPTFCAMSETVCDLANSYIKAQPGYSPPHRMEEPASIHDDFSFSFTPAPRDQETTHADVLLGPLTLSPEADEQAPPSNCPFSKPLGLTDVFVDDFIQLGQGGPKRMKALRRHLLHAIDQVLATPGISDEKRLEALSLKKMLKGDGSWNTRKVILGWIIDTLRQTLELPPHRKQELARIFSDLSSRSRVSRKTWERTLGKLHFMHTAIPGSAGLFGALRNALTKSNNNRIRITRSLRAHIDHFSALASSLRSRPTHLAELVPQEPTLLGATDAAKAGMGGVFYNSQGDAFVWRSPFPTKIQSLLVSTDNPTGSITNSDLEHAGILAQLTLMAELEPVRYATLSNGADNTPAVARMHKGATTSEGPAARLCHYQSAHQRLHRYCSTTSYLPGRLNVMADDASRLQHLTDSAFLCHFEQHYPQPRPWKLLHLSPSVTSNFTSMLLCSTPETLLSPLPARTSQEPSPTGPTGANNLGRTAPSVISHLRAVSSTSSPMEQSTVPEVDGEETAPRSLSELAPWIQPSKPWARGSPTWVSKIHASSPIQIPSRPSTSSSLLDWQS